MAYEYIIYEKKNHVAYITLSRPERMNALGNDLSWELSDALMDFENDSDTWVAILTGAGDRAFSAGADLKDVAASDTFTPEQLAERRKRGRALSAILSGELEITKPLIGAANGIAYGGGCGLISTCDMIVAAEHARFGLPEARRSIIATGAGARFFRSMPRKIASQVLLTGGSISAQEAYQWGFVNKVVPASELMLAAQQLAEEVLEAAPLAVRASKRYVINIGLELPVKAASTLNTGTEVQGTEDQREGPRAFVEKRKPVWKGR